MLEEELLVGYTGSQNAENEKEQQFKELQLKESQALASENYDLAEEIATEWNNSKRTWNVRDTDYQPKITRYSSIILLVFSLESN